MKRISIIFILVLLLFFNTSCDPIIQKPFQTFEKEINETYSIQFSAYEVNCLIICDAEYALKSFSGRKMIGKRLLTITGADPIKISPERLVVKNKNIAYFSIFNKFAITIDGGKTWSVWDSYKHQKLFEGKRIGWITEVEINSNGTGKMKFEDWDHKLSEYFFLTTRDFGKTWQKP